MVLIKYEGVPKFGTPFTYTKNRLTLFRNAVDNELLKITVKSTAFTAV